MLCGDGIICMYMYIAMFMGATPHMTLLLHDYLLTCIWRLKLRHQKLFEHECPKLHCIIASSGHIEHTYGLQLILKSMVQMIDNVSKLQAVQMV